MSFTKKPVISYDTSGTEVTGEPEKVERPLLYNISGKKTREYFTLGQKDHTHSSLLVRMNELLELIIACQLSVCIC